MTRDQKRSKPPIRAFPSSIRAIGFLIACFLSGIGFAVLGVASILSPEGPGDHFVFIFGYPFVGIALAVKFLPARVEKVTSQELFDEALRASGISVERWGWLGRGLLMLAIAGLLTSLIVAITN